MHGTFNMQGQNLASRPSYSITPTRLQNCGHMILVDYAWSMCTLVRSPLDAHNTEVAVSFYYFYAPRNCILAGRVSATLLTRPFLLFWVGACETRSGCMENNI